MKSLTESLPGAAALKAEAGAYGVSPDWFAGSVLQSTLGRGVEPKSIDERFETGCGMRAEYGPGPSAQSMDENGREMPASERQAA